MGAERSLSGFVATLRAARGLPGIGSPLQLQNTTQRAKGCQMPEYLPVFVVGLAIAAVATICYYLALVRPEPGPRHDEAVR